MTLRRLVVRSAVYHWRTNLAVVLGVAAAVSVLAGASVVGDSVRSSLREIALGRLGNTDAVVTTADFFRDGVAADVQRSFRAHAVAPLIVADGFVTHEPSGRRAAKVLVDGVDERFWTFNGLRQRDGIFISPALAAEIGAREGDVLLTRLQRPSQVPVESLFGRKDDIGRTIRLSLTGVLPREQLGEFALRPQQTAVRAVFAPLRRIQRDLDVRGKVNTILISNGTRGAAALRAGLSLDDLGVKVSLLADGRSVAVETTAGILAEPVERAARVAGEKAGLRVLPVFTYLANTIRKADRQIPYSLVTAIDLGAFDRESVRPLARPVAAVKDAILLNAWAARELSAASGDRIDLDYYLWDSASGLTTASAAFAVEAIVPIEGLAADRRLAPDYPGITSARSLADWDPPFPIDLSRTDARTNAIGTSSRRHRRPSSHTSADASCGGRHTARPRRSGSRSRMARTPRPSPQTCAVSFCRPSPHSRSASPSWMPADPRSRRRAAPPTLARTSRTSASSWSCRPCCSRYCFSSWASNSVSARLEFFERRATPSPLFAGCSWSKPSCWPWSARWSASAERSRMHT